MDIAVAEATVALSDGLSRARIDALQAEFNALLPAKGEPEHLSDAGYNHYSDLHITAREPMSARNVCDFVLALAHRRYAFEFDLERWQNSTFKEVPIGIPRTRNRTPNARNYTPHGNAKYRSYRTRLIFGELSIFPQFYAWDGVNWVPRQIDPLRIDLTKTDDTNWLHTRVALLPRAWTVIDQLVQEVMRLTHDQRSENELRAILGGVAQIHWWFSHAMPYRRGSAAIGDMLCKSILTFHQVSTPSWRMGLGPDLEALCQGLLDYTENYETFFVSKPRFLCS
jgi:hypothetical protein